VKARGIPEDQLTANGTLLPFYEGFDPEKDQPRYALQPESFQAVIEGYACGECLKWFGGLYMAQCPTCGADTGAVQVVPAWWTEHPELVK